jgi:hypothetical protein
VVISAFSGKFNIQAKIIECLEVLCDPGYIEIVQEKANTKPAFHFSCDYFSTKWLWKKREKSKILCYQFDAMSCRQEIRRPTDEEILDFQNKATDLGWSLENLGNQRPLKESVRLAAKCHAFVGVVSGLMEVCTSIGVPMHVVVNNYPNGWVRTMYAGRKGRLYTRLPTVDLSPASLHEVGMI